MYCLIGSRVFVYCIYGFVGTIRVRVAGFEWLRDRCPYSMTLPCTHQFTLRIGLDS